MSPNTHSSPRRWRLKLSWLVATLLIGIVSVALVSSSTAQRRRTPPPPPPILMDSAVVSWSLFVSSYGETPAVRRSIDTAVPGPIPVPLDGWSCIYGATSRARLNDTTWSEVRNIECIRGDAVVSTSGFCQVVGGSWGARAGVLSIGSTSGSSRLSITLDCEVH